MYEYLHTHTAIAAPRLARRTRKRVLWMMTLVMIPLIAAAEAREYLARVT